MTKKCEYHGTNGCNYYMRCWHDFLDSLDSDGGKIFILLSLIVAGAFFGHFGITKAEDVMMGALGALLLALKVSGSNKDRREGEPMPLPTTAGAPPVAIIPDTVSSQPVAEAVQDVAEAIKEDK